MTTKTAKNSPQRVNVGMIIGIVIGAVCLAALAIFAVSAILRAAGNGLHSSANDTMRRSDLSRVSNSMSSYRTNNSGKLPADGDGDRFITNYLTGINGSNDFADPDGHNYKIRFETMTAGKGIDVTTPYTIFVIKNSTCNEAENGAHYSSRKTDHAVLYHSPDSDATLCVDND